MGQFLDEQVDFGRVFAGRDAVDRHGIKKARSHERPLAVFGAYRGKGVARPQAAEEDDGFFTQVHIAVHKYRAEPLGLRMGYDQAKECYKYEPHGVR